MIVAQQHALEAIDFAIINRKTILLYGGVGVGKTLCIESVCNARQCSCLKVSAMQVVTGEFLEYASAYQLIVIEDIQLLSKVDEVLLVNMLENRLFTHKPIDTSHMLFICTAVSASTDFLSNQLISRFSTECRLNDLNAAHLRAILEQKHQYERYIDKSAIPLIADIAYKQNQLLQNIGARRLDKLLHQLAQIAHVNNCIMTSQLVRYFDSNDNLDEYFL